MNKIKLQKVHKNTSKLSDYQYLNDDRMFFFGWTIPLNLNVVFGVFVAVFVSQVKDIDGNPAPVANWKRWFQEQQSGDSSLWTQICGRVLSSQSHAWREMQKRFNFYSNIKKQNKKHDV